jgi:hypothetical protein
MLFYRKEWNDEAKMKVIMGEFTADDFKVVIPDSVETATVVEA